MTEPLSDSALGLLIAVSRRQGWMTWEQLVADLSAGRRPPPRTMTEDMAALIRGGTVQTRGSMTPEQLDAELRQAVEALRQAQASGTVFTWKTAQTILYGLTRSGADMVRLLNESRRGR